MRKPPAPRDDSSASILLVDDNSHGLIARKTVLEELGYAVTSTLDPVEALDLLAAKKFDVLVTDYKMPQMTGVELIVKVRERIADMRIILLSGFVEALGLDEGNTGADVVISKSARELTSLTRALERLLANRRKPAGSQRAACKTLRSVV